MSSAATRARVLEALRGLGEKFPDNILDSELVCLILSYFWAVPRLDSDPREGLEYGIRVSYQVTDQVWEVDWGNAYYEGYHRASHRDLTEALVSGVCQYLDAEAAENEANKKTGGG